MEDQQSNQPPKPKWYFRKSSLIVSFLVTGPFMLPLIWMHPKMSQSAKIIWTLIVIGLTLFLGFFFVKVLESMLAQLKSYESMLQGGL